MAESRVQQWGIEVTGTTDADVRVQQFAVEAVESADDADLRVQQFGIEVVKAKVPTHTGNWYVG